MFEELPATRTLNRAAELCGGIPTLARVLGVPVDELTRWMEGVVEPPVQVYYRALDFVARIRIHLE